MPHLHQIPLVMMLAAPAATSADVDLSDPGFDIVRYDVSLRVTPEDRRVEGEAAVTIRATRKLEQALFSLNDRLHVGSVRIGRTTVRFEEGPDLREGRGIRVSLPSPLRVSKEATVTISYAGEGMNPDASGPDWMGILLVRDDEIRMSHQSQWYPVVPLDDRVAAKLGGPMSLRLDLPKGMNSLGPGTLERVKKAKRGREVHHWVPGTRFFACREELVPSTRRVTAPSGARAVCFLGCGQTALGDDPSRPGVDPRRAIPGGRPREGPASRPRARVLRPRARRRPIRRRVAARDHHVAEAARRAERRELRRGGDAGAQPRPIVQLRGGRVLRLRLRPVRRARPRSAQGRPRGRTPLVRRHRRSDRRRRALP